MIILQSLLRARLSANEIPYAEQLIPGYIKTYFLQDRFQFIKTPMNITVDKITAPDLQGSLILHYDPYQMVSNDLPKKRKDLIDSLLYRMT